MRLSAAISAAAVLATASLVAQTAPKPKPPVDQLKGDLKKVQSRKGALSKELSKTKRAVRAVRGDLNEIDGRLDELEGSLHETKLRLSESREEQIRLTGDLKIATHLLQEKREQVRGRLRAMYTKGSPSLAMAVLGAESIGDFASRTYLLERIATADRRLFDAFGRLQKEVADKKRRQDVLVVRIAGLRRTQESQHADLEDTRGDKAHLLSNLKDRQQDLERLVRQLDEEEAAIEARIASYYRGSGKTANLPKFTGRFSRPVGGPITSGFGMRFHPILRRNRMHNGIDFGAGHGSPIHAAADGIVIASTYGKGYGNMVILDHGGGMSTLYGHCSRRLVGQGQRVRRGQVIATVGATGLATGPHLHWEVRVNGKAVNPRGRL